MTWAVTPGYDSVRRDHTVPLAASGDSCRGSDEGRQSIRLGAQSGREAYYVGYEV